MYQILFLNNDFFHIPKHFFIIENSFSNNHDLQKYILTDEKQINTLWKQARCRKIKHCLKPIIDHASFEWTMVTNSDFSLLKIMMTYMLMYGRVQHLTYYNFNEVALRNISRYCSHQKGITTGFGKSRKSSN